MTAAIEFPPALQQRLLQLFDDVHCAHVCVINLRDRSVVLRQSAAEHNPAGAATVSAPPQTLQDAYIAAVAAAAAPFDSEPEDSVAFGGVDDGGWETLRMHAPPHWDIYAFRCGSSAPLLPQGAATGVGGGAAKQQAQDRFVLICFYRCRKL